MSSYPEGTVSANGYWVIRGGGWVSRFPNTIPTQAQTAQAQAWASSAAPAASTTSTQRDRYANWDSPDNRQASSGWLAHSTGGFVTWQARPIPDNREDFDLDITFQANQFGGVTPKTLRLQPSNPRGVNKESWLADNEENGAWNNATGQQAWINEAMNFQLHPSANTQNEVVSNIRDAMRQFWNVQNGYSP
ncbi:uncharacterized protein I303_107613 [Kwoniella dejecticola CBS 10117]|uniref:Uncharacterized protein n=1 Tax=Kwoniella dejecticola CBS 10117 TaxID=1296121 RepID=A0A1A5ZV80_9TREE|nr:uncharacterized protein I303_07624 [Kwoniella dejecticola CBS 10117]OBR81714.1 hypothetical protein I303_07624 [Kwoniella dejecticola CBS 10117]